MKDFHNITRILNFKELNKKFITASIYDTVWTRIPEIFNIMDTEFFTTKLDRETTSPKNEASINAPKAGKKEFSRSGKILDTGWSSIPNCAKFRLDERKLDPRWLSLGIEKKVKIDPVITEYKNGKMNQYMKYQIKRLYNMKSDPVKFWKTCKLILLYSSVFRVSAINHVCTNWYKSMEYYKILRANKKVDKIIKTDNWSIVYHRVYIPKKNTFRPLGVPTLEWRIYLHMINNFMHMFVKDYLLPSQHGFIPGRGTLSAWKEIMTKAISKPYIYECDLKQFFPSVNVSKLGKLLETDLKVPLTISTGLFELNSSLPILPKEVKLNENYTQETRERLLNYKEEQDWDWAEDVPDSYYNNSSSGGFKLDSSGTPEFWENPIGVPQGAPTSPLISILILVKSFLTQTPSISYADDPIFYSDRPFEIQEEPDLGVLLNKEKSDWVKKDGLWLTDLKYLGLKYSPFDDSLSGNTRKGSRLQLSVEYRDKILKVFLPGKPLNWASFFRLKDIGMIFSRLYIGSWKSDALVQDFNLFPEDHSWTSIQWSKEGGRPRSQYSIFNVSSLASQSLCRKFTKIRQLSKKQTNPKIKPAEIVRTPTNLGSTAIIALIVKTTNSLSLISVTTRDLSLEFNVIIKKWNLTKLLWASESSYLIISKELAEMTQEYVEITRFLKWKSTPCPTTPLEVKDSDYKQLESLIYQRIMNQFKLIETQLLMTESIYNIVLNSILKLPNNNSELSILKQSMLNSVITVAERTRVTAPHTPELGSSDWTLPVNRIDFPITLTSSRAYKYIVYNFKKSRLELLGINKSYKEIVSLLASVEYSLPATLANSECNGSCNKTSVSRNNLTQYQKKNFLIVLTNSFLITFFTLHQFTYWPELLGTTIVIENTGWSWSELIGIILIAISMFLFIGIWGWYVGIIPDFTRHPPVSISPREVLIDSLHNNIESLKHANNRLTTSLNDITNANQGLTRVLNETKQKLSETSHELNIVDSVNGVFKSKMESLNETLLVIRKENLSLMQQLPTNSSEFKTTNILIDLAQEKILNFTSRIDSLFTQLKNNEIDFHQFHHHLTMLFDEYGMFNLINRIGQAVNLDSHAATLLVSHPNVLGEQVIFESLTNPDLLLILVDRHTSLLTLAETFSNFT